jgi:hypothetical protein
MDAAIQSGAQEYLVKSKADFNQIRACIENHLGVEPPPTPKKRK